MKAASDAESPTSLCCIPKTTKKFIAYAVYLQTSTGTRFK